MRASRKSRTTAEVLAAVALVLCSCCGSSGPTPSSAPKTEPTVHPPGRVFIIGLDGADWEIIDRLAAEGRLPNLTRLRREGASGVLKSEEPLLSPIVWTTIATGRSPAEHGIVGFLTTRNGRTEPVRSDERRVRAFWNIASDFGVSVGVIGWYASWPAEPVRGFLVSDRVGSHQVEGASSPATTGLAWPAEIVPQVESLRDQVDRDVTAATAAKYFSSGDAHGGATVPIEKDRLDTFVGILRTTELYRRLVPVLERRFHPALSAVYFEGTDAVGHLFAEYEPPPLPWTTAAQRAHFGPAFGRYYDTIDGVVGELVSRLDPSKTTVIIVSDHGFRTGARRPRTPSRTSMGNQAPLWHRPEGIVLLWGRGVKPGATIKGASIYDVLPTVLRLLDIPIAKTLEGHVLDAALRPDVLVAPARTVADYEAAGERQKAPAEDLPADEEMAKLRALGYIGGGATSSRSPAQGDGTADAGQRGVPLNRYNEGLILLNKRRDDAAMRAFQSLERDDPDFPLGYVGEGLVHLRAGRPGDAVAPLEKAASLAPELAIVQAYLGEAYLQSGRQADARRALEHSLKIDPSQGRPALLLAETCLAQRDLAGAARWFETARKLADDAGDRARACVGLAVLAEQRQRFDEAERLYAEALRETPDLPAALERYGNLELYRDRPAKALDPLARLVAARGDSAQAHKLYARALAGVGRTVEAEAQVERALSIAPNDEDGQALLRDIRRAAPHR